MTTHKHLCPLCEASCGLDVTVADGEVTLIRGDRSDTFSRGFLCPKGTALKELQTDPDRLRLPLVKRNGVFVEVSFEEAFAEVARRLGPIRETFGPAACGLVIGNPTVHRTGLVLYVLELAVALGSPNVFSAATLDQMPKQLAVGRMFGDFYSIAVPDIDRTDLLVIIGANPMVSNGSMWSVPDFRGRADELRARGGRIITIDPRRTETAAASDVHLPIRPGRDVYLLAAVISTLFEEGLVDLDHLEPLTNGVSRVADAVESFSAERVAPRSGIGADDIRSLARDIAAAPRAAVYGRLGTCLDEHATLTNWLIDVINVLTGNLDKPGGVMFPKAAAFASNTTGEPGKGAGVTTGAYRSRVSGAPEVMNQFPIACLVEEIDTPGDGQLRALVMLASNAALSVPDGPRLEQALDSLDFLVCLDVYLNDTTRHADVIIPGPSPLEEDHYDVYFSLFGHRNAARYSPAILPAPDMPSDADTMLRLVAILQGRGPEADLAALEEELTRALLDGQPEEIIVGILQSLHGATPVQRRLDLALRTGPYGDWFGMKPDGLSLATLEAAPSGIDLGALEPRLPEVLRTPSGLIELAPAAFIHAFADANITIDAPIPECLLVGRRHLRSNNSWMHNLTVLAKGKERCTLLVHPDDAQRWSLDDEGKVEIMATDTGVSLVATVEIDDAMMPGVVSLPHGWGHDPEGTNLNVARKRPGVNYNLLASASRRDPLSGNPALNGISVRLSPR